jgi:hypothetical protein
MLRASAVWGLFAPRNHRRSESGFFVFNHALVRPLT